MLLDVGPSPGEAGLLLTIAAAAGLTGLFSLGVWLFALVDALKAPEGSYPTGSKLIWTLVIVLLGIIGAVVYLLMGRPKRA